MGSARSGTTRRRASVARRWSFWRHVGGPILAPALPRCPAAAVHQRVLGLRDRRGPHQPGRLDRHPADRGFAQSEVVIGQENVGKALALGMIIVVVAGHGPVRLDPAARVAVGEVSGLPATQMGAPAPEGGALIVAPKGGGQRRRLSRGQSIARIAILVVVLGYLLLPLFAMLEFSTRGDFGSRSLDAFAAILGKPEPDRQLDHDRSQIAVLTVVGMLLLLVPTMAWTYRARPAHEAGGRVPVPAAARHPGDRPGRRDRADLSLHGPNFGNSGPRPDPRIHRHHPGPAVRLSRASMPAFARSTRPRSPTRLGALAPAGPGRSSRSSCRTSAQAILSAVGHHHRTGAGRVHDLVAAHLRHAPGRDRRCSASAIRSSRWPCRSRPSSSRSSSSGRDRAASAPRRRTNRQVEEPAV